MRFIDGQLLSAADLTAEQDDQIGRLRRHAIGAHTWGIVDGGELKVSADGLVEVAPAFAYDGYGREVVLTVPQSVDATERFELLGTDVLDVWLVYRRDPADAPLADGGCADGDRAGRWSEEPLVRCTAAAGGAPAARQPPGVPRADIPFPPNRTPPDDPTQEWPVFLGRIHRSLGQTPGTYNYRADTAGRPYAGARAATIEPPWGKGETRLAVDPPSGNAIELSVPSATTPILSVSTSGDLELEGEATIDGSLQVGGGHVTLEPGAGPAGSAWRIAHVAGPGGELRIEVGAAAGRVVIGSWSDARNAFVEHLTVTGSGEVTVAGNLRVEGDLDVGGEFTTAAADLQIIRKAYIDALKSLALTGNAATQRDALVADDVTLGTTLGWPAP